MARYTTTIETEWPRGATFDYLAEFSNIEEWDPGVRHARSLDPDPLSEGARFTLDLSFVGRSIELTYETLSLDRPRQVVLRAETASATSLDTISCDRRPGGGTLVTYEAELTLKGALKLASPALVPLFNRLGDAARDGLAERLADPSPERDPVFDGV